MNTETVTPRLIGSSAWLGVGSELYRRALTECLPEHQELMAEVWSPTPWMLDVNVGGEERRREIRNWCNRNLGPESSPIHGNEGDWHEGNVTMHGWTLYGFKTDAMAKRFEAQFCSPNTEVTDAGPVTQSKPNAIPGVRVD